MSTVTALRAARGGYVAVHVDGCCVCTVSESFVARWDLHEGRVLDGDMLDRMRAQSAAERALADGQRLLGHRARSRREVETRLLKKGHVDEAVAAALERLASAGLLDDADFARRYVADKQGLSGWGVVRIRRGLAQLGVPADLVDAALTGEQSGCDEAELERALRMLSRKGAPEHPLETARRRAYQALLRRGFSAPVAYSAVRAWSNGMPAGSD